jgi:hypothetical protein
VAGRQALELYRGLAGTENSGVGTAYYGQPPPARLPPPAGRFTAAPWIPPPYLLPVTIKGYLAAVTVHQGGVSIGRSVLGMLNLNHSAAVGWHEMVAIHFVPPNILRNGYVHFATPGDPQRLSTISNGRGSATRHPHVILFRWHHRGAYRQLRDLLTGVIPLPPQGPYR